MTFSLEGMLKCKTNKMVVKTVVLLLLNTVLVLQRLNFKILDLAYLLSYLIEIWGNAVVSLSLFRIIAGLKLPIF